VTGTLNKTPRRTNNVDLTDQAAAIAATDMGSTPRAGLYRLTYYARITQAATTSSSLTVTLDWTDGVVNPSYSGAAITGNTTTTTQSGSQTFLVDARSAINYSTAYASVGATPMQYALSLYLEELPR
jgi:hypothetical protein